MKNNKNPENQNEQHVKEVKIIKYIDCSENDQEIIDNFFKAIICKDIQKVKQYLDEYPTLVFYQNNLELTCLHVAAIRNHYEIINLLLDKGANPNTPLKIGNLTGVTSLHYAAAAGGLESINVLLAKGANLEARDVEGEMAWAFAKTNGHELIAFMLTPTNEDGHNPIDEILSNKCLTELAGEIEHSGW